VNFDKIVRDNVPDIIRKEGRRFIIKEVSNDEAIRYLVKKIHEEADEILEANNMEKASGELADLYYKT
jgi:predicted house-cleaning noncanonical NTP pyrophosphatase (MazG superfamily)